MSQKLLDVERLVTQFSSSGESLSAVKEISFSIEQGETVCIVGESGCGKSITALSIMGLLPRNGKIAKGSIYYKGIDLTQLPSEKMREMRGNEISIIFQEPMTALNPVFTVGYQIAETLINHKKLTKKQARQRAVELLDQVGIPSPINCLDKYPHELSGGMRQRVMIAMALACEPALLIADEPTTALDVTIQAQILDLINDLKEKFNMGVLMITHDMGVVAEVADRVIVMYAGEIIEEADVDVIFTNPQHPYTKGLLGSVPNVDDETLNLESIPGTLPNLDEHIVGCTFHPRCEYAFDKCFMARPKTFQLGHHHYVSCWLQEVDEH